MMDGLVKVIFPYNVDGKADILELLKAGIYHGEITGEEYQRVKEALNG